MGAIQSSINTALGVAAIASGLTNKKQVEKAQDKLDKSEEKLDKSEKDLAKTKKDLTKTKKEKDEVIKQQAEEKYEQKIQQGGNTFDVSNDLPNAKETNINNIGNNSVNDIKGLSPSEFIKVVENKQEKVDPYTVEQIKGFHALRMSDAVAAAKRARIERSKRAMIKARKIGGNE